MSKKDPNSPWINVGPKSARRKLNTQPGEQYVQDNYIEKFIRSAYFGGYIAVGSKSIVFIRNTSLSVRRKKFILSLYSEIR